MHGDCVAAAAASAALLCPPGLCSVLLQGGCRCQQSGGVVVAQFSRGEQATHGQCVWAQTDRAQRGRTHRVSRVASCTFPLQAASTSARQQHGPTDSLPCQHTADPLSVVCLQVHFEASQCSPEQLVAAVEGCGFGCQVQSLHSVDTGDADADRLQTTRLRVGGMTCGACSGLVERGLLELPGVSHAAVSLTQVCRRVTTGRQCNSSKQQQQAAAAAAAVACGSRGGWCVPRLACVEVLPPCPCVPYSTVLTHAGKLSVRVCVVPAVCLSCLQHEAEVTHSSDVAPEALVAAVQGVGYEAHVIATAGQEEAVLAVSGMNCGACSGSVESALRAVPGVSAADVSAITNKAQVGRRAAAGGAVLLVRAGEGGGIAQVACGSHHALPRAPRGSEPQGGSLALMLPLLGVRECHQLCLPPPLDCLLALDTECAPLAQPCLPACLPAVAAAVLRCGTTPPARARAPS